MRRMDNPTLSKALRLLVHPATLAAAVLLLVNDHLLRQFWPSALTGKLGDFAWLFFIPFAVIALLALLWQGNSRGKRAAVPAIAFGGVALVFALAKSAPVAHEVTVRLASALFGFEVAWRRDPSDLVALVSLVAAALLWRRAPEPANAPSTSRSAGWVSLLAAMLLTVANSPAPDPGIYCLDARDGELLAFAGYSTYRSVDGGMSWAVLPNGQRSACPNPWDSTAGAAMTVRDPASPQRSYRFTPGQMIELSEDGEASWQTVREFRPMTEAERAARSKQRPNTMIRPVPLHGVVDRETGNAVFAMGQAGVLVHAGDTGQWREVAVGEFTPLTPGTPGSAVALLLGEQLLALGLGLLAVAVFATRTLARGKALWIFALAFGWLLWGVILFVFSPALATGYGIAFAFAGLLVLGVLLLITTIISMIGLAQAGRGAVGRALLIALAAGLLFLTPFVFWATNALPNYLLAAVLGAALGVTTIAVGSRWVNGGAGAGGQAPELT
jgi:hypothetical protein